jgi:hypothetical protein
MPDFLKRMVKKPSGAAPAAKNPDAAKAGLSNPGETRIVGGCNNAPLAQTARKLPFGPDEELHYDVRALGMRTGRVRTRVGPLRRLGSAQAYAIRAQAQSHGLFAALNPFKATLVTFLNPTDTKPLRMHSTTAFRDGRWVRERARFFSGGKVEAKIEASPKRRKKGKLQASSDVVDVLSLVYYARDRALLDEQSFCLEVYHRRHLWRVEGQVAQKEVVSVPATTRWAHRIEATVRRLGGGRSSEHTEGRPVTAWLSADRDRLPLKVRGERALGTVEMVLIDFVPGRRLSRSPR